MHDNHGFIDVSFAEIQKYIEEVNTKRGLCKVLPQARFFVTSEGFEYDGLVCKDLGGKSTGCAAFFCKNCELDRPKKKAAKK